MINQTEIVQKTKYDKNTLKIVYETFTTLLALVSIVFVFLDLFSVISLSLSPFRMIDLSILVVFWIEYITRFIISKQKWHFVKTHIFDLIAIIPLNEIFALFRLARIFRLTKLMRLSKLIKATRLVRAFGFVGILKQKLDGFFKTNGFIYMIYCSAGLILSSSVIISYVEKQSFLDALWWSIVTCTTVGYGDISPSTGIGRIVAVILMIFGIGFIGMLTGTITTYFANKIGKQKTVTENNDITDVFTDLNPEQQSDLLKIANAMKNNTITLTVNTNFDNTK